jgi:type IV secretory pathway VirB3-like protein
LSIPSGHASPPFDILGIVRMMWLFLILASSSGAVLLVGIVLYLRVRRHMKKEASHEMERER